MPIFGRLQPDGLGRPLRAHALDAALERRALLTRWTSCGTCSATRARERDQEAIGSIREGESIAEPLKRSGEFPPIVTHMIAVGEKSGQLEAMLENVSRAYDTEVETAWSH